MDELNKPTGLKYDGDKPKFGLIPPHALEEVAKVMTVGAKKYAPDNWKYVEDGRVRYIDAMGRHLNAFIKGETQDPETGLHHLAHAMCCALFIVDADVSGMPLAKKAIKVAEGTNASTEKVAVKDTKESFVPAWPILDSTFNNNFYNMNDRKK